MKLKNLSSALESPSQNKSSLKSIHEEDKRASSNPGDNKRGAHEATTRWQTDPLCVNSRSVFPTGFQSPAVSLENIGTSSAEQRREDQRKDFLQEGVFAGNVSCSVVVFIMLFSKFCLKSEVEPELHSTGDSMETRQNLAKQESE